MQSFLKYLSEKKLSSISLKNYKSDFNHFASWVIMKVRTYGTNVETLEDAIPFLSASIAVEYKQYLEKNNIPLKTINRRLSTLRSLSKFLKEGLYCDFDFMAGIENKHDQKATKDITLQPIINDFKAFLASQEISEATIKNYISDINQFAQWLEKKQEHAQSY